MQVISLVALAGVGGADELVDDAAVVVDEEVLPESLECFLDAFVARVCELYRGVQHCGGRRDVDTRAVHDEAVRDAPGGTAFHHDGVPELAEVRGGGKLVAEVVVELERWCRDGEDAVGVGVGVAARQGVGHDVEVAGSVLHSEIIGKQFAYPLVLWHRRQALIEHELEHVVVSADAKPPPPRDRGASVEWPEPSR